MRWVRGKEVASVVWRTGWASGFGEDDGEDDGGGDGNEEAGVDWTQVSEVRCGRAPLRLGT